MKNKKTIDPNIYYKWMYEVLKDFFPPEQKVDLDLKKSISSILESLRWPPYEWVLLVTSLEMTFNIDINDEWVENLEITLGELLANITTLEVSTDKSFAFRKARSLGYLNVDLDYEEDESKDSIMN